jgi:hypothetical protein
VLSAQRLGQFVAHHLDHLLGGGQRLHDLLGEGALTDAAQEVVGHVHGHVGLQQGLADLPEGLVDLLRVELPSRPELLEDPVEPAGELLEHPKQVY